MFASLLGGAGGNDLVRGGIFLLLFQSVGYSLTSALKSLLYYLLRSFVMEVNADNNSDVYRWCLEYAAYLSSQGKMSSQSTSIVIDSVQKRSNYWQNRKEETARAERKILRVPSAGVHLLFWRYRVIVFTRTIEVGAGNSGAPRELISLATVGWDKQFFQDFVEEARQHTFQSDFAETCIYAVERAYGGVWKKAVSKPPRDWNSVILDGTISEDLFADAAEFLRSEDTYRRLGIPYRRSYLLYGPPGTGKTSLVSALAARLNYDISYLSLAGSSLSDETLAQTLRQAPPKSIILLEDVDVAFPDRENEEDEEEKKKMGQNQYTPRSNLTLSGLLNAIDGVIAQEGRICVFSSNHIEKLDPALRRPGRMDRAFELGLATRAQIRTLFLRFYPEKVGLADLYSSSIKPRTLSMAEVQGHLIRCQDDPMRAVKTVKKFVDGVMAEKRKREEYLAKRKAEREKKNMHVVAMDAGAGAGPPALLPLGGGGEEEGGAEQKKEKDAKKKKEVTQDDAGVDDGETRSDNNKKKKNGKQTSPLSLSVNATSMLEAQEKQDSRLRSNSTGDGLGGDDYTEEEEDNETKALLTKTR